MVITVIIYIYCIFPQVLSIHISHFITSCHSVASLTETLIIAQALSISIKWEVHLKLHLEKNYFPTSLYIPPCITQLFSILTVVGFHKILKLGGLLVGRVVFSYQPQEAWQTVAPTSRAFTGPWQLLSILFSKWPLSSSSLLPIGLPIFLARWERRDTCRTTGRRPYWWASWLFLCW